MLIPTSPDWPDLLTRACSGATDGERIEAWSQVRALLERYAAGGENPCPVMAGGFVPMVKKVACLGSRYRAVLARREGQVVVEWRDGERPTTGRLGGFTTTLTGEEMVALVEGRRVPRRGDREGAEQPGSTARARAPGTAPRGSHAQPGAARPGHAARQELDGDGAGVGDGGGGGMTHTSHVACREQRVGVCWAVVNPSQPEVVDDR
jgi:hypothetical protein